MTKHIFLLLALCVGGAAEAACPSLPYSFVPGAIIASAQVNADLGLLLGCVNTLSTRLYPTLTSTGSGNAQVLTYGTPPAGYTAGDVYTFFAGFTNTGPANLNINSLGVKNILLGATALVGGEIVAGRAVQVYYDGVSFQLDGGGISSTTLGGTGRTSWTSGSVPFLSDATHFGEDNANFLWDETNHRLGIGTTVPLSALTVKPGTSPATGLSVGSGIGNAMGLKLYQGTNPNAGIIGFGDGTGYYLSFGNTGGGITRIYDNGNVGAATLSLGVTATGGATTLCGVLNQYLNTYEGITFCASDARLKDITGPIDPAGGAAALVDRLQPSSFSFKSDSDKTLHSGFIAQQVKDVMPECVTQNPDGYYSVETNCILAYAVKAQQERGHWLTALSRAMAFGWLSMIFGWVATAGFILVLYWRRA